MVRKTSIALAAALLGCVSAPPNDYYATRGTGVAAGTPWGYTDYKLKDGVYFVASTYWDNASAAQMFTRRAQELCSQAGFDDFTLSRDLMYAVAVVPGTVFPPHARAGPTGVTREANVTCRRK